MTIFNIFYIKKCTSDAFFHWQDYRQVRGMGGYLKLKEGQPP
jgi:hypothetical protein